MSYLRLQNVTVDFPLYQGGSRSLKRTLLASSTGGNFARDTLQRITVRALDNISVNIENGDRIGLIGFNGAGKTTLLRVLAGIYEPSQGRVLSEGKRTALLDASVGLDNNSTGRENIILRGMYMDMHPSEIRPLVEEIAAFSGLGAFLDLPVRTYSAGMRIRLAFAVSTCVQPEVLLMDEWLAAGDAHFIDKAQRHLKSFVRKSSIFVLASHSIPLLEEWCDRAMLLDNGHIIAHGPVADILATYRELSAGE